MTNITAISKTGISENFDVTISETVMIGDKELIKYEVRQQNESTSLTNFFDFQILKISEAKRMVYMINNNYIDSLSNKGIVKAMIKAVSEEFNCDVISSTNIDSLKINRNEGRIDSVTIFWRRWVNNMDNVEYLNEEDRFIYRNLNR